MKYGLILLTNVWYAPYLKIYTHILKDKQINYDVISWNRDGRDKPSDTAFSKKSEFSKNQFLKIFDYIEYYRFTKRMIKKNNYDKLIIFGSQIGILLYHFLNKNYKNKYIFDFRDLSIEQKVIFKYPFNKLLKGSFMNVISSPGFKKALPKGYYYFLSHNFNIDILREKMNLKFTGFNKKPLIEVLTIGGIRDLESNLHIVKSLSNKPNYLLNFVGQGIASEKIQEYSEKNRLTNVEFQGYYEKCDEGNIVEKCSILNIFYPNILSHSTALSNRFYNALMYKKPMIVTKNSTQGDFVDEYKLGIVLDEEDNLDLKIKDFFKNTNFDEFSNRCNDLLQVFILDYNLFYNKFIDFIDS